MLLQIYTKFAVIQRDTKVFLIGISWLTVSLLFIMGQFCEHVIGSLSKFSFLYNFVEIRVVDRLPL